MEILTIERLLPELMPGDLFATPPVGPFDGFAANLINAEAFHWGLIVHPFLTEAGVDYEIMEAIPSKGVAVGLLNKMYSDVPIRVYRVKAISRPDERQVERIADSYGRRFYSFTTIPGFVIWWIRFHLLRFLDAQPPAPDLDSVICTGFVTIVWKELGVELVPQYTYPTPDMLEKSQNLEYLYGEF